MIVELLLGLVLLLCFSYFYWTCNYWRRHGIDGPRGHPLIGNMWDFCIGRKQYGEVYQEIYNAYSQLPYVGIYRVFNEPAILLHDLDMVKEIMIRSFHHFQDNVLWIDPKRDPIIWCNPFVTKGEKWKQMRAEILPIFTPNKVKSSFPHIATVCKKLDDYVEQHLNENFEAKNLFSKYTLDVVASAGYGLDAQCFTNTNSDFTKLVEHLFLPNPLSLVETTALLFSPMLGNLIKYRYVPTGVQKWLTAIIGSVLATRQPGSNDNEESCSHSDFIQWLLEAKHKSNEPVDAPTIVGHCSTFLVEGFETSSSLMAFALFEYARNSSIQSRVLQEIDDILRKNNNDFSYDAIQQMTYFEATLFETLRLHPPMQALLKHCTKPFTLQSHMAGAKQYVVKEGTVFVIPVRAIHYDPKLYPEPTIFKPERFLGDNAKQKMSCSFLGFGEGPRMCPGMRFGLAQSKAGLVKLLSKYTVHLVDESKSHLTLSPTTFLTAAKDGIWIKFKKRKLNA